jgi:hypothetical protein
MMKKLLAWTLALAMLFVCLSAAVSAAGFTDGDSIGDPYKTAVEQMTALGVLNGFPDGTFQPKGTLTREQGAKIIAYMRLGSDVNALTCSEAPFADVEADRWSAPSIAWCADRGILLGYGDGTFGPTDPLTGDQFAKMLLCAFSLGDPARYAGIGWYERVREDAGAAGLYAGDSTMATDRAISREQAALLAWNAIKAAEKAAADKLEAAGNAGNTGTAGTSGTAGGSGYDSASLAWLNYLLSQLAAGSQTSGNGSSSHTGEDIELPDLP